MENKKYSKILNYLADYAGQKAKPVRDIENSDEYSEIIWLDSLPKQIFTINSHEVIAEDMSCWIRICKPRELREPVFKPKNDVLDLWADKESLKDENGTPKIMPSIFVNGRTLLSTNYPQIEKELKDYVKEKWLEDLIAYKEQFKDYEKRKPEHIELDKIYNQLLEILRNAEKAGEEFELMIGVGLLNVHSPRSTDHSDKIKRHLLTCKAEIEFDQALKEPVVRVLPDVENMIQIEADAIIAADGFDYNNVIEAEKELCEFLKDNGIIRNIFDNKITDALRLFAEKVNNGCEFIEGPVNNEDVSDASHIYFAPALMLRKINHGGFSALFDRIIRVIEEEEDIDIAVGLEKLQEEKIAEADENSEVSGNITGQVQQQEVKINSRYDLLSLPEFLVFTSKFNVYKVQNKVFSSKMKILEGIEFEPGEKPIYVTGTRNYSGYLLVAYENGKMGKISLESYKTEFARKKLKSAYNDESPLVFIEHIEQDIDLVAISSINKVMLFNTKSINSVGSRTTKGFHVMKSKDGSTLAKVKKLEQVKFQDPAYYRREDLNVVGFYLKPGDDI